MRSLSFLLLGTFVMASLVVLAPGCGGTNELEKPPEVKKQVDPMTDMPGMKEQTEKLKKEGKFIGPKS
jgi:hypothetical protein